MLHAIEETSMYINIDCFEKYLRIHQSLYPLVLLLPQLIPQIDSILSLCRLESVFLGPDFSNRYRETIKLHDLFWNKGLITSPAPSVPIPATIPTKKLTGKELNKIRTRLSRRINRASTLIDDGFDLMRKERNYLEDEEELLIMINKVKTVSK